MHTTHGGRTRTFGDHGLHADTLVAGEASSLSGDASSQRHDPRSRLRFLFPELELQPCLQREAIADELENVVRSTAKSDRLPDSQEGNDWIVRLLALLTLAILGWAVIWGLPMFLDFIQN